MKHRLLFIVFAVLLSACASSSYNIKYPLHNAIYQNDMRGTQELIKRGTPINTADNYGMLPIHVAASNNSTELVKLLLSNGADANSLDAYGNTAISYAASNNSAELVKLLLSSGADVNARDGYGNTPILSAAEYCSSELMRYLIENDAQTNVRNCEGNTILHNVSNCLHRSEDNKKILAMLTSMDIDANAINEAGQSAYGMAMDNMNLELVALLRAKGAIERVGTTSSDKLNEDLKKPSYFTPPTGYYYVPVGKELLYQLAVEDCNSYSIPNKKGLFMFSPVFWAVGITVDQVRGTKKFSECMKVMGFEPLDSKK